MEILSNRLHPVTPEAVEWAYRMILARPPENPEVINQHLDVGSVEALRTRFQNSPEATGGAIRNIPRVPAHILEHFPPWQGRAENDSFRDFLGTRTRLAYMPEPYASLAGRTEGVPGMEEFPLHDPAEWTALLRAVLEADGGRFVGVELGAGWGPWVVAGAMAARQRGINDVQLAAVEGAADHVAFIQQHFRDNDLDPDAHIVMHGAVGAYDGTAKFPRLADPSAEWGAEALYADRKTTAGRTEQVSETYDEVPCISVPTLLGKLPPVDIVHMDIQGSELEVIRASIDALTARVRRLVIGTHGRDLEAALLPELATAGWQLELESPCALAQHGNGFRLLQDGVQVWRNGGR